MSKYRIFIGKDKKYYFAIEDNRGNVLLKSQGYTRKDSAKQGMDSGRIGKWVRGIRPYCDAAGFECHNQITKPKSMHPSGL